MANVGEIVLEIAAVVVVAVVVVVEAAVVLAHAQRFPIEGNHLWASVV